MVNKMLTEYLIGIRISAENDTVAKELARHIHRFVQSRPGIMYDAPSEGLDYVFDSCELAVPVTLQSEEHNLDDDKKYEPEKSVLYAADHADRLREVAHNPDPRD
jgi:hypothetical protein